MRTSRLLIFATVACVVTLAHAFEPGHDRICTASANGQTFECRDKTTGAIEKPQAKPAEAASTTVTPNAEPAAAKPPPATATAATPAPMRATNKLPNYLMQNPAAAEPERIEPGSAVAGQPSSTGPRAGNAQATAASASTAEAQASLIQPAPAPTQSPAADPAPAPHPTTATSPPLGDVPRAMPESAPLAANPEARRPNIAGLPGASAFLALPANHYTLVLASVRDPSALDDLIKALDAHADRLYLLKLNMPDGDWYSLCWSDFADLDAARAARASLPADAPIRSGWPRRIDLLQKEIAR